MARLIPPASCPRILVLVVAAEPELPVCSFVPPHGRAVKDSVVAHQELQAAPGRRVDVIDGVAVSCEGAEAGALGEVSDGVGAGRPGVLLDNRWQRTWPRQKAASHRCDRRGT